MSRGLRLFPGSEREQFSNSISLSHLEKMQKRCSSHVVMCCVCGLLLSSWWISFSSIVCHLCSSSWPELFSHWLGGSFHHLRRVRRGRRSDAAELEIANKRARNGSKEAGEPSVCIGPECAQESTFEESPRQDCSKETTTATDHGTSGIQWQTE